jgi:hypothetical protein
MKRSWIASVAVIVGVAVLGYRASSILSAADAVVAEAEREAAAQQPDYSKIGQHDAGPDGTVSACGTRCLGFLPTIPTEREIKPEEFNTQWRSFRPANKRRLVARRKPSGVQGPPALQATQAVDGASRIALKDLRSGQAQIIAILTVGLQSSEDARYGLSRARINDFLDERVYVVAHDYDISNTVDTDGSKPTVSSRRVARWSLWGIQRTGGQLKLVSLQRSGWIRWCGHAHDTITRRAFATYTHCDGPSKVRHVLDDVEVMRVLEQYASTRDSLTAGEPPRSFGWLVNVLSAFASDSSGQTKALGSAAIEARIRDAVNTLFDPEAPAWFVCGVGCCIADI